MISCTSGGLESLEMFPVPIEGGDWVGEFAGLCSAPAGKSVKAATHPNKTKLTVNFLAGIRIASLAKAFLPLLPERNNSLMPIRCHCWRFGCTQFGKALHRWREVLLPEDADN